MCKITQLSELPEGFHEWAQTEVPFYESFDKRPDYMQERWIEEYYKYLRTKDPIRVPSKPSPEEEAQMWNEHYAYLQYQAQQSQAFNEHLRSF